MWCKTHRMAERPRIGAVTEFFRYHGAWAPGVRLFRAVGFRAKAMIISLCFAVPIAVLAKSHFVDKATTIAFSTKEREGIVFGRSVMPLLDAFQRERPDAALDASSSRAAGVGQTTRAVQDMDRTTQQNATGVAQAAAAAASLKDQARGLAEEEGQFRLPG